MKKRYSAVLCLLMLSVGLALSSSCTPAEKPGEAESGEDRSSHEAMLALLEDVRLRTPDENRWLGDKRTREFRKRLAELPPEANDQDRWRANLFLGIEELRLGNERQAIEHLTTAYGLMPPHQHGEEWAYRTTFRLGLAYMRYGETQNCSLRHTSESCILPIRGTGVHVDPEGSEEAIRYFTEVLEHAPESSAEYIKTRWLMNIAYMTLGSYPDHVPLRYRIPPEVFEPTVEFPRFINIAPDLGLNTFNLFGGVVTDDFNNDGYLDILTTTFDTSGQTHLFINDRDGTFSDRYREAGLEGFYGGLNMVQADYDNDGYVDAFILRGAWLAEMGRHPNSLLHNNGDGTFTDVTLTAGLGTAHYPTQTATWGDYDNDGDVDLFVGNESGKSIDAPSQLFRNNGDGTFTDVAEQAGIRHRTFVKGSVWGDYDSDRLPDLYVSSMGGENLLYRNNGDGTFTDVAGQLGVKGPIDSFPVWFWDYDNDGVLDLYVPSYRGVTNNVATVASSYLGLPVNMEPPALYRGDGKGGFSDVAAGHGLTRVLAPMGANRGDLDNDGFLDFYLGTGYPEYEALMPNVMYRNVGGSRFEDVTYAGGFGHLQKGHAVAFADLDNDGDLDIFAQMGGALLGDKFSDALFENPGFGNRWISIQLVGEQSNRSAIGARIRLDISEDGQARTVYKYVNSGGSFGTSPLRQTIGLGRASRIERLEIYWPTSDITQTFENVNMDQFIRIRETSDAVEIIELARLEF